MPIHDTGNGSRRFCSPTDGRAANKRIVPAENSRLSQQAAEKRHGKKFHGVDAAPMKQPGGVGGGKRFRCRCLCPFYRAVWTFMGALLAANLALEYPEHYDALMFQVLWSMKH